MATHQLLSTLRYPGLWYNSRCPLQWLRQHSAPATAVGRKLGTAAATPVHRDVAAPATPSGTLRLLSCDTAAPATPSGTLRMFSSSSPQSLKPVTNPSSDELLLSDSCINRLRQLNQRDNNTGSGDEAKGNVDKFLRIVVEGGGCSGFQYKFELDDKLLPDDRTFGQDDARVVIDEISLSFVKGSKVEYYSELIRSTFRIVENPQSEAGCSCGASFSVKL